MVSGRFRKVGNETFTFTVRVIDTKIRKVTQDTATKVLSITVS